MELIDIKNIDYVRLEDSLHCLEHHKGDEVECVICAPLIEAIPKADYENRLKADMVAMLTELKNKLIDKSWNIDMYDDDLDFECCYLNDIDKVIQQKINALKEQNRMRIRQVGEYEVSDKGVELVVNVGDCGTYTTQMVLPKEIFIECYNKWIKELKKELK